MNPRQHLPPQERLSDEEQKLATAMAGVVQQTRASLEKSKEMIELRKWCVDAAIRCMTNGKDVRDVAESIHDFVHAPIDAAIDELIKRETR